MPFVLPTYESVQSQVRTLIKVTKIPLQYFKEVQSAEMDQFGVLYQPDS